mgnify:CR=1 FL=1
MHAVAKLGSCEFTNIENSIVAAAAIYTAGTSPLRFSGTKNHLAQIFYSFGFLFGSTAMLYQLVVQH